MRVDDGPANRCIKVWLTEDDMWEILETSGLPPTDYDWTLDREHMSMRLTHAEQRFDPTEEMSAVQITVSLMERANDQVLAAKRAEWRALGYTPEGAQMREDNFVKGRENGDE